MITISVGEVVNAVPVLSKLTNQSFSGAATFKIARLLKSLDKEIALFEETRMKLIQKYCIKNDDGSIKEEEGQVHIEPDKIPDFNEEMNALMKSEITISGDPLDIEYFEKVELTPAEASLIEAFVK